MEVLCLLVQHQGEVVSREEIIDTVWKDTVVVEMVLTRAISEIRKVFGDDPVNPSVLETIPKRGYRLIAEVKPANKKGISKVLVALIVMLLVVASVALTWSARNEEKAGEQYLTTMKGWEFQHDVMGNRKIAFVWKGHGSPYSNLMILDLDKDSSWQLPLEDANYFSPIWHSNGSALGYYKKTQNALTINSFNLDSNKETTIFSPNTRIIGMDWSKDGKRILVSEQDTTMGNQRIFELDLKTGTKQAITSPAIDIWGDRLPRYKPDQRGFYFVRSASEGDEDLFEKNDRNSEANPLTSIQSSIYGYDFPDRHSVVLSTTISGNPRLYQASLTNLPANLQDLIEWHPGNNFRAPQWLEKGVVVESWQVDADNYQMTLLSDGSYQAEDQPIASSSLWDLNPTFSHEGSKMAFISNRSGKFEVWLHHFSSSRDEQISSLESSYIGALSWSPDDTRIALHAKRGAQSDIAVIDLLNRKVKWQTESTHEEVSPTWLGNDRIVYSTNAAGNWKLEILSLENGKTQVLNHDGAYIGKSSDHEVIYFTKFNESGIWKMSLNDMQAAKVIDSLSNIDENNWEIHGDRLYYVVRRSTGPDLIKYRNLLTDENHEWVDLGITLPANDKSIAIHPKLQRIIYGKTISYNSDLLFLPR